MFSKESFVNMLLRLREWSKTNPKKAFFYFSILFYILIKYIKNKLKKPKSLFRKVVFITGGASGIGRKVALQLKQLKAVVIVCDINETAIQEMSHHVDMSVVCDVTNHEKIKELGQKIEEEYGGVDILINNAGIVVAKPILELKPNLIKKVFDVNILAHFWTIQTFLPKMMEKNRGHIVTIASASGVFGVPNLVDYSSTKFACRGLDQSLKREMDLGGYKGIKFTCINPYFIDTGMFDGVKHSKYWFLRQINYLLDPNYVSDQIVKSIQYEWRDVRLPYFMGFTTYLEHILPLETTDWVIENVCDVTAFQGH